MKKFIFGNLMLIFITFAFAQETGNDYWYTEVDVGGELITYYVCKTDAQFNNNFKKIVKEQLGIEYDWREPNWNTIKSSFISREGIKKNFPKYYNLTKDADADVVNWDDYKYLWSIRKFGDVYIIALSKRVNGTKYVSFTAMGPDYQWAYTKELLAVLERSFN